MARLLHPIYVFVGHFICKIILLYCVIRDKVNPPKEDTVLFVTHPDDDTLFFHTAIKEYKPYVALMVTGWSLKRLRDFFKVMKYYGVKFRPYDTNENSTNVEQKVMNQVGAVLKAGNFKRCLTHNEGGEYGHHNHQLTHRCVVKQANCEIFVPVSSQEIVNHPIDSENVKEKENIFNNFYVTETFVLDEYSNWVKNEKLVRFEK